MGALERAGSIVVGLVASPHVEFSRVSCIEGRILIHCTTREVPGLLLNDIFHVAALDRCNGFEIEQNLPGIILHLLNSCDVPGSLSDSSQELDKYDLLLK